LSNFCEACGGKSSETAKFCAGCGASVASSGPGGVKSKGAPEKKTTFEARCAILAQVWLELRDVEDLDVLMREGAIGFPLAYAIDNDIVVVSEKARALIDPLFQEVLESIGLDEDEGWEDLDDLRREDFLGILDSPEEDD
jgi:hypothetical protein